MMDFEVVYETATDHMSYVNMIEGGLVLLILLTAIFFVITLDNNISRILKIVVLFSAVIIFLVAARISHNHEQESQKLFAKAYVIDKEKFNGLHAVEKHYRGKKFSYHQPHYYGHISPYPGYRCNSFSSLQKFH